MGWHTNTFSKVLNNKTDSVGGPNDAHQCVGCSGLCYKALADDAYFIKHNLQVCQANALPCYPCAVGTANTALRTSGSANHDLTSCSH